MSTSIISTASSNQSTLDSVFFFKYLPKIKRSIIELFFRRTVGIFCAISLATVLVSDGQSNFSSLIVLDNLQSENFQALITLVRVETKFFYHVLGVGWKLFSENFPSIVPPFCQERKFFTFNVESL